MWNRFKKVIFLPYHLDELSIDQVFKISFLFLTFLHIYAALLSEGFHRPDEHLGMIRMVLYQLGKLDSSQLSWEFPVQIRSWAQPFCYFIIAKLCYYLGLINPFILATLFRLFSSLMALIALFIFMRATILLHEKDFDKKLSLSLFPFIWYLPFFHARTSTENFSSSFTLISIAGLIYLLRKKTGLLLPFIIGLCMAFAFYFRLQMAACLLPALISFVLFYQKENWKMICTIVAGGLSGLLLNTGIDYLGYGNWVFSPWNNIYQNVFKGMASGFGTDPFYTYFSKTFLRGIPPVSLFFLFIPIIYWLKRPRCILTWASLPFLIAHSSLAHKELRFIFFLGQLIPSMAPIFLNWCKSLPKIRPIFIKMFHSLIKTSLVISLILTFVSSGRDAYSHIGFYKFLYQLEPMPKKIYTLNVVRDVLEFYLPGPIEFLYTPGVETGHILTDSYDDFVHLTERSHCKVEYSEYSTLLAIFYPKLKNSKMWFFLQCPSNR